MRVQRKRRQKQPRMAVALAKKEILAPSVSKQKGTIGEPSPVAPVDAYKNGLAYRPKYTELEKARLKDMVVAALGKAFTIGVAARTVGISRATVVAWQDQDDEFRARCQDQIETRLDQIEENVVAATENLNQPHKMTGSMFMLHGYRRERFMPMTRHEHTGPGGGPILQAVAVKIKNMTDDELRAELGKLLGSALVQSGEESEGNTTQGDGG